MHGTTVDLLNAAIDLVAPGLLDIGIWRTIELFQQDAQQLLLIRGLQFANFLLDLGKWSGHGPNVSSRLGTRNQAILSEMANMRNA